LVVFHITSSTLGFGKFWCVHGGSVEVLAQKFQFIEGQTYLGMSRGGKMSLALCELKYVAIHSNADTFSGGKIFLILPAKLPNGKS
jgi:hypothetical protein